MGMMFQPRACSATSVADNIAFPIRENFDLPEEVARRMVRLKLNAVGLRGARDMRPGDQPGGAAAPRRSRRAIGTDPKLLMYDEPFGGLDPSHLNQIVELIRTLNEALGLHLGGGDLRRAEALQVAG
jgi:phospholipid/cholesterol/gamma-HCH transport system ATP-binding protein